MRCLELGNRSYRTKDIGVDQRIPGASVFVTGLFHSREIVIHSGEGYNLDPERYANGSRAVRARSQKKWRAEHLAKGSSRTFDKSRRPR